jgi:BTB/POZ domain-containing protein KCTD8/12/16
MSIVDRIVELNIGGIKYTTQLRTLCRDANSDLYKWFQSQSGNLDSPGVVSSSSVSLRGNSATASPLLKDTKGRYFIDRDGSYFRYILDYLRQDALELPESFQDYAALRREATFYGLQGLVQQIDLCRPYLSNSTKRSRFSDIYPGVGSATVITIGYRGTFAFGRDGLTDVKFRKLSRILCAGRVSACRDVFGDTLNDSRDPDMGGDDRYSSRFFLKHGNLEQAFEILYACGYDMVGACASGTSSSTGADIKPGQDSEEHKWQHYNEFVFVKK